MKTYTVEVTQTVTVTLDETKFDEPFMEEFRRHFYGFDTIEEHVEHLAQLEARGLVGDYKPFVEGYGRLDEMGVKLSSDHFEEEIVESRA